MVPGGPFSGGFGGKSRLLQNRAAGMVHRKGKKEEKKKGGSWLMGSSKKGTGKKKRDVGRPNSRETTRRKRKGGICYAPKFSKKRPANRRRKESKLEGSRGVGLHRGDAEKTDSRGIVGHQRGRKKGETGDQEL